MLVQALDRFFNVTFSTSCASNEDYQAHVRAGYCQHSCSILVAMSRWGVHLRCFCGCYKHMDRVKVDCIDEEVQSHVSKVYNMVVRGVTVVDSVQSVQ